MRYVMPLAALASVLAVMACATGCGTPGLGGAAMDKALLPLIPADTKVLADVQLDKLKATPLYQRHRKDLTFPLMEGSTERLGIDPERDVAELLVAWTGKSALFLVRGRFDPDSVAEKLSSLGAPRTTYKNHPVFGDRRNSVAFVSKNLAVIGDPENVERTLDRNSGSENHIAEELRQRLRQVPREDQIWIVSQGLPFADAPMPSDLQSALSNITDFISGATVGVQADTGTHLKIDLTCISEQGARRVHDALRGVIGLGRLSTKDNQRELLQVYDGINVDQDKALVHVHADYSGALTDKLFDEWHQFAPAVRR